MGRIHRLPNDLANQIAAGEVVERPASVVKELLENSVDAGATRITVDIERGGADLVRVSDDGEGMDASDALLCLERHATSKIRNTEDLFSLSTFGFRGEALPSIASVSKLRLVTRTAGMAEGTEIRIEGGSAPSARPTGASQGTSVEVADLFFNVPARRKFLKSTGTEAAHVSEAILLSALSRCAISFFLVRDGRPAREWLRAATRQERASQAFDGEELEPCLRERGNLRIEGYLAAPERARAGAGALYLLVNGRPVRDRALARAVAQAYGSVLEPGRYPIGVVYLEVPLDQVDVNVHPQKAEVRFADARGMFGAVTRDLHDAMARIFSIPALGVRRTWTSAPPGGPPYGGPPSPAPYFPLDSTLPDRVREEPAPSQSPSATDPWQLGPQPPLSLGSLAERTRSDRGAAASPSNGDSDVPLSGPGFYGALEFLAQVRATFLLCSGADGLYVLDQHAAAERVTFHRLKHAYRSGAVATQRLLLPEMVALSSADVALLEEHAEDVQAIGLEVRAVGTNAVAVHAIPALLARASPERTLRDLVAELAREAKRPFSHSADLVLATMACHGSLRAGDTIAREEALALLASLDRVDFAGHCPHGRPVVTRIGYDELERRVGR